MSTLITYAIQLASKIEGIPKQQFNSNLEVNTMKPKYFAKYRYTQSYAVSCPSPVIHIYYISCIFFFPITTYTVLHFTLGAKTTLTAHQSLGYCWTVLGQSHRFLFLPLLPSYSEEARGKQLTRRGWSQDSWRELVKGIFPSISCHAW